jgi:hypothetical protein
MRQTDAPLKPKRRFYLPDFHNGDNQPYPICHSGLKRITKSMSSDFIKPLTELVRSGKRLEDIKLLTRITLSKADRKAESVRAFFEMQIKEISDCDPTSNKIILNHGSIAALYDMYKMDATAGLYESIGIDMDDEKAVASRQYFHIIFNKEYRDFVELPRKGHKFSRCSYCADLKMVARHPGNPTRVRQFYMRHQHRHYRWVKANRDVASRHAIKAKTNPMR